jgi:hypothetical protein
MGAAAVVDAIGGLTLVGRLAGGEGAGAYEVRTAAGARAVLKYDDGSHLDFTRAARTVDVLRARGYPAPAYLRTGAVGAVRFGITELAPGTPLDALGPEHLATVCGLVNLQRAVGIAPRRPWIEDMVTSVTDGRAGYCEHASLATHSAETAALLAHLRRTAAATRDIDVPLDDAVHMDFHARNMLHDGHRITAVVDWEGSTTGDGAFDLVTQAFYADALRGPLLDAARARTDPRALQLYAAHMALRQVDWSIRHHGPEAVQWAIATAGALLDAVGAG